MHDNATPPHPYRRKMDGSFDLLCLACLRTIAIGANDAAGNDHACEPAFLFERSSPRSHNAFHSSLNAG